MRCGSPDGEFICRYSCIAALRKFICRYSSIGILHCGSPDMDGQVADEGNSRILNSLHPFFWRKTIGGSSPSCRHRGGRIGWNPGAVRDLGESPSRHRFKPLLTTHVVFFQIPVFERAPRSEQGSEAPTTGSERYSLDQRTPPFCPSDTASPESEVLGESGFSYS